MASEIKWENQTDRQKTEQLRNDLDEAVLAIKNLTHDVGRLAARLTTTEISLKALETSTQIKPKTVKR
jgi:hypothetical protein